MKIHFLIILFSLLCFFNIYGQKIKDKTNSIKISASIFKDFLYVSPLIDFDDKPNVTRKKQLNINLHFCKKTSIISEFGVNFGFVKYSALNVVNSPYVSYEDFYAPIFGFNYNFHFFSLLNIRSKKIDIYCISHYGFTYLSKIGEKDLWEVLLFENENESKIRHIYGLGLGGSVLLFKSFSIFFETLLGNYSLRSELVSSFSNTKIGIYYSW